MSGTPPFLYVTEDFAKRKKAFSCSAIGCIIKETESESQKMRESSYGQDTVRDYFGH